MKNIRIIKDIYNNIVTSILMNCSRYEISLVYVFFKEGVVLVDESYVRVDRKLEL